MDVGSIPTEVNMNDLKQQLFESYNGPYPLLKQRNIPVWAATQVYNQTAELQRMQTAH